ncbi:MAG TPA: nucleotidyltransferase family protein [Pyrinomonadaceae bacterium]|nr:nucleotidyltransferase family protein [Pyrinomonadaceae bacterium]
MGESDSAGVGAVVLAAGSSSRMGTPKQLLRFRGQSLLRRAALAALTAECRPVIVVTGANAAQSREELRGLDVREAVNDRWETGMASSVRAGVSALLEADASASAVVLMLCDQPYVTGEVVAALVAAHRDTGRPVVASRYGGGFGAPALFARPLFAELAQLEGASGAKHVIRRHAAEAQFVPFPGGETDVDTPDDFSRLLSTQAAP